MVCEICGNHNPEDSVFCEACGSRIVPEPIAEMTAEPEEAVTPDQQPLTVKKLIEKAKQIHQKNKLVFPIAGGVLALLLVAVIVFSILAGQVSVRDYLNISISGYDGFGSMTYDFGEMSFGMRAAGDKDSRGYGDYEEGNFLQLSSNQVRKSYRKNLELAKQLVDSVKISVTMPEGRTGDSLENGDVIVFTVEYDEKLAKKLGFSVRGTTVEYKVEHLQKIAQFDVLSNFNMEAAGYNGYGEIKMVCSQTGSKQVGNVTFDMELGKETIRYRTKDGAEGTLYTYIEGSKNQMSNGDNVKVSVQFGSDDFVRAGVELIGLEKEYTVSNLTETQPVDILQYYKVTFTGLNGSGKATLEPTQDSLTVGDFSVNLKTGECTYQGEFWRNLYVNLSKSHGLSNDEKIKLYFNLDDNIFLKYGYALTPVEKELTVTGLASYVTTLSQIQNSDAVVAAGKQVVFDYLNDDWAGAVHNIYWGKFYNQAIGEDMKLHNMVLTTPKSSASTTHNDLWLIYSVTLSDNKITTPTVYYFAIRQSDVAVYGDGTLYADSWVNKYNGYTSYEALYEELIKQFNLNIESYN